MNPNPIWPPDSVFGKCWPITDQTIKMTKPKQLKLKNLNKAAVKKINDKAKTNENLENTVISPSEPPNQNTVISPSEPPSQENMKDSGEHNYSIIDPNICSGCQDTIGENDDGIQCEVCEYWYCVACSGMSITFYKELVNSDIADNFIWYCNGCKKAIPGVRKVLQAVSTIKESQDALNERIENIETKLHDVHNQTDLSVDYKIEQAIYDFREREKRKTNVIIYNLPESKAEDGETKKTQEAESIKKVCDSAQVQFDIEHYIRLGEKKVGPNARPRPLKVVLQNDADKQKLIRNGMKLKVSDELVR